MISSFLWIFSEIQPTFILHMYQWIHQLEMNAYIVYNTRYLSLKITNDKYKPTTRITIWERTYRAIRASMTTRSKSGSAIVAPSGERQQSVRAPNQLVSTNQMQSMNTAVCTEAPATPTSTLLFKPFQRQSLQRVRSK